MVPLPNLEEIGLVRKEILFRLHPSEYLRGYKDKTLSIHTRITLRDLRDRIIGIRYLRNSAMKKLRRGDSSWRRIYGKINNFLDLIWDLEGQASYYDLALRTYVRWTLRLLKRMNHTVRYLFGVTPEDLRSCPVDITPSATGYHWHCGRAGDARPPSWLKLRLIEAKS